MNLAQIARIRARALWNGPRAPRRVFTAGVGNIGSWPVGRRLACLFLISLYLSGAPYFAVPAGPIKANLSPANLLMVLILGYYYWTRFAQERIGRSFWSALRVSTAQFMSEPSWLRLPLAVSLVFVTSILIGAFKPGENIALAKFFTGLTGIGALLVVAKTLVTWDDAIVFLRLLLILLVPVGVLTLLGLLDVIPPEKAPYFFNGYNEGRRFAGIQFPSGANTTFAFVAEILALYLAVGLSLLLGTLRRPTLFGQRFSRVTAVALAAFFLFIIVIVQNRSAWMGVLPLVPLMLGTQVANMLRRPLRFALIFLLAALPAVFFAYVIFEIGGPISRDEIYQAYLTRNRPHIFGVELPRDSFVNAVQRLRLFEQAGNWLLDNPLTGAPDSAFAAFNGHSAYPQMVAAAGAVPIVGLLALLVVVSTKARRVLTDQEVALRWAMISAVYAMLLMSLFFFGLFLKEFFMACGLLMMVSGRLSLAPMGEPAPESGRQAAVST